MAVGKRQAQLSLFEVGLCPAAKMLSVDTSNDHETIEIVNSDDNDDMYSSGEQECDDDAECDDGSGSDVTQSETRQPTSIVCNKLCCFDEKKVYQPRDNKTLALFTNKSYRYGMIGTSG